MRIKLVRTLVLIGLASATATVAFAHVGVKNAAVMERMEVMKSSKQAIEVLVAMVDGSRPFDADTAAQARRVLIRNTEATTTAFRDRQDDPKSEALPLIWQDWAGFEAKNTKTLRAAQAMRTGSLPKMQADLLELGASCVACHEVYRKVKK